MMKTNAVPAVVMLLAGLIDCVASIYQRLSLFDFTKRLLLVLVVFYLIGCVAKLALDICMGKMQDPQPEEGEENPPEDGEETAEVRESAPEEELENIDAQDETE